MPTEMELKQLNKYLEYCKSEAKRLKKENLRKDRIIKRIMSTIKKELEL